MTISLSPTQSGSDSVTSTLRSFLASILPFGMPIVLGQANRVPEPKNTDFVVITPIRRQRLETNVDQFVDAKMTGSIAGTLMTVTELSYGSLKVGSVVYCAGGTGVVVSVQSQSSGSAGGTGIYVVSPSGSVGSGVLAAGVLDVLQPINLTIQIDVHGPSGADNAQTISTMLRDDYACRAFKAINPNIVPLHADDPKQIPFINAEQAFEDRWIIECCLHVNETVLDIPQQFFDQITVERVPADIKYPA